MHDAYAVLLCITCLRSSLVLSLVRVVENLCTAKVASHDDNGIDKAHNSALWQQHYSSRLMAKAIAQTLWLNGVLGKKPLHKTTLIMDPCIAASV